MDGQWSNGKRLPNEKTLVDQVGTDYLEADAFLNTRINQLLICNVLPEAGAVMVNFYFNDLYIQNNFKAGLFSIVKEKEFFFQKRNLMYQATIPCIPIRKDGNPKVGFKFMLTPYKTIVAAPLSAYNYALSYVGAF